MRMHIFRDVLFPDKERQRIQKLPRRTAMRVSNLAGFERKRINANRGHVGITKASRTEIYSVCANVRMNARISVHIKSMRDIKSMPDREQFAKLHDKEIARQISVDSAPISPLNTKPSRQVGIPID